MVKVLLVDDSPIVTRMVSSYLSEKGYSVLVADGPFGVSGKIKEFQPHVVLMDLNMPGLSGDRLIRLCRERGEALTCRVVLFSSSDEGVMRALVEGGVAHDYFVKGGSLGGLEAKIRSQVDALRRADG